MSRKEGDLEIADHWLRSEEHTSELQSQSNLVCRLLLEKKNAKQPAHPPSALQRVPRQTPRNLNPRVAAHGDLPPQRESQQLPPPLLLAASCIIDLALIT